MAVGAVRGYGRSVWRTVECLESQRGYLSERGVVVLYQSAPLYRPHAKSPKSQGAVARHNAEHHARKFAEVRWAK